MSSRPGAADAVSGPRSPEVPAIGSGGETPPANRDIPPQLGLRYFQFLEAALDEILVFSRDGRLEYINRRAAARLGVPPSSIIGLHIREVLPTPLVALAREQAARVYAMRAPVYGEHAVAFPDGTSGWRSAWFVPLKTDSGEIQGILCIARDITARKRTETELLDSREAYKNLAHSNSRLLQAVEASAEIIFMTDRDGVITFVNREFERVYGYTADEVVQRTTPRILKGGDQSPQVLRDVLAAALARRGRPRRVRESDERRPAHRGGRRGQPDLERRTNGDRRVPRHSAGHHRAQTTRGRAPPPQPRAGHRAQHHARRHSRRRRTRPRALGERSLSRNVGVPARCPAERVRRRRDRSPREQAGRPRALPSGTAYAGRASPAGDAPGSRVARRPDLRSVYDADARSRRRVLRARVVLPRRHRAQAQREPAAADAEEAATQCVSRRADRAAQPVSARGAAGPRADGDGAAPGPRLCARLHRSRQLQTDQRQSRSRRRRPSARGLQPPASSRRCGRKTRSPGSAATSSSF